VSGCARLATGDEASPSAAEPTPTIAPVISTVAPTASPSVAPSTNPTPAASLETVETCPPLPSAPPQPSASPFDPELEALLPCEINGFPTVRVSFAAFDASGGDFCPYWPCFDEMPRLAKELGSDVPDIHVAEALNKGVPVIIGAVRLPGKTGSELLSARIRAQAADIALPLTVGGKQVTWAWKRPMMLLETVEYLYVHGDVLFIILYRPTDDFPASQPPPTPPEIVLAVEALP
jgi:hypothetical protein